MIYTKHFDLWEIMKSSKSTKYLVAGLKMINNLLADLERPQTLQISLICYAFQQVAKFCSVVTVSAS